MGSGIGERRTGAHGVLGRVGTVGDNNTYKSELLVLSFSYIVGVSIEHLSFGFVGSALVAVKQRRDYIPAAKKGHMGLTIEYISNCWAPMESSWRRGNVMSL